MNNFIGISNPFPTVRALESFTATNLHVLIKLSERYFLSTKFAFLRLKFTSVFVISKPTLHFCKVTVFAFNLCMFGFLMLLFVGLLHTHSTNAALDILPCAPHGVHSELRCFDVLTTNITQFSVFRCLIHFYSIINYIIRLKDLNLL